LKIQQRLSQAQALAKPFWRSSEAFSARLMLAAIVLLNLVVVGTALLYTLWQGAFFNALDARDSAKFVALLFWWSYDDVDGFVPSFLMTSIILVPATVYATYIQQALEIKWRNWDTRDYIDSWLHERQYYEISLGLKQTDNPDQRISEDIRLFISLTLDLAIGLLKAATTFISYVIILWELSKQLDLLGFGIPGELLWIAIAYAAGVTFLAHLVGSKLIPINFDKQRLEANFRFALIRFSENAEQIAFYKGEQRERQGFDSKFREIKENWRLMMRYNRNLSFFTLSAEQIALILPMALVAPAYFAEKILLGVIFQTSNAFFQVQESIAWVANNYVRLSEWMATVERLSGFRVLTASRSSSTVESTEHQITLRDVQVSLPEGKRLIHVDNIAVRSGDWVMLTGASGSGKSTLLRVLAGIWPFVDGTIQVPTENALFMPQKVYMPISNLRRAIAYPGTEDQIDDKKLKETLTTLGRSYLIDKLDVTDDWSKRLSAGELQHVALLRALVNKPKWLFLDEPTANLHPAAKPAFFQQLKSELSDATVICVTHDLVDASEFSLEWTIDGGRVVSRQSTAHL